MTSSASLDWWERYGRYLLSATLYRDEVLVSASNCTVIDADGNEYLDLSAGQICAGLGHQHPELLRRLSEQMERLVHTGTHFVSPPVLELARKLASVAPGSLERSLFLSTGAEANEYALRLAKAATGKTGVLALTRGYAGLTVATTSLSNFGKGARPLVPGTGFILTPDPTHCPPGREPLDWARELLRQSLELNSALLGNLAAIIVEPILSAGGLIVPPDGYLRELRAVADDHDALLIADEAQTGLGRTGRWFGVDHDGVVPDILVLSKGFGGGFPLSAVVTSSAVADLAVGKANQFSSHQCDPLAAAAGLAVIDITERENLVGRASKSGDYLLAGLRRLADRHPHLRNVRGRGLMIGFDVFRDPAQLVADEETGRLVEDYCRARGVICESIQKNRFRILPPLTISEPEIDRFTSTLDAALEALASGEATRLLPRNPLAVARRSSQSRGLRRTLRWAWQNSPSAWVRKLRRQ